MKLIDVILNLIKHIFKFYNFKVEIFFIIILVVLINIKLL